jgi:hypothetical protein
MGARGPKGVGGKAGLEGVPGLPGAPGKDSEDVMTASQDFAMWLMDPPKFLFFKNSN